jgi:hypothetical protein
VPDIIFTLSAAAETRLVAAIENLYPIPVNGNGDPLFTANAWVRERTKRWWREQILRSEQTVAMSAARNAVTEVPDGDISHRLAAALTDPDIT